MRRCECLHGKVPLAVLHQALVTHHALDLSLFLLAFCGPERNCSAKSTSSGLDSACLGSPRMVVGMPLPRMPHKQLLCLVHQTKGIRR
jgi:hypothetical protein